MAKELTATLFDSDLNRETALAMAAECATQKETAEFLGVSPSTFSRALAKAPAFRTEYESVLYDASAQLLERLREIPFTQQDAGRARVQIDALQRYLELRWPARYGKRMEVTVKHADMRGALDRAKLRAGRIIEGEVLQDARQLLAAAGSNEQGEGEA